MDDPRLQPSLQQLPTEQPLYSTRTLFLSAFFGGPWAGLIVFTVNARRAARLPQDGWAVALGAAVALALPALLLLLAPDLNRTTTRMIVRGAALLLAGGLYLRHRDLYRGQELFGADAPHGLRLGLGAVVLGALLTVLTTTLLVLLGRSLGLGA